MSPMMRDVKNEIRPFLHEVRLPARYVGGEWNAVTKDPARCSYRVALCYPDVYEIGMSHLGLALLYHIVNTDEDSYAERCFAPGADMAARMVRQGIPLFGLETGTPLTAFDLVGFSLQHELLYTNVLYMLDLAGIPLRSRDRGPGDPLIAAGGSGAHTPEPMADAFDLFLVGDGEVVLPPVLGLLKSLKREGASRAEMLRACAAGFPFAYVPGCYAPRHDGRGRYEGLEKLEASAPDIIRPGLLKDLEAAPIPTAPVQPGIRCVHDRITLEIMRGCTRGCRFCQAGMIKRPLRARSPRTLVEAAKAVYENTGYDEISLCSLSSADYPELGDLMRRLNEQFEPFRVGLSLPSLRVGQNLKEIPGLSSAVRKAGLTLAPEAATDRLRRSMNKGITHDDLESGLIKAYEQGWRRVKLYFMIGLPGETEEDVRAIARLARRTSELRRAAGQGPAQVTVSVSTFVPKAHTPFQWCPMDRLETIREKHRILTKAGLPRRIRFNFHDSRMSFVEAVLARGGRRVFEAIRAAYGKGACFDAWKDLFSFPRWERALSESGIDPETMLYRERDRKEVFPWDHIDPGVKRSFLRNEYERSVMGVATLYCEGPQCNNCGIDPGLCKTLKRSRAPVEETGP